MENTHTVLELKRNAQTLKGPVAYISMSEMVCCLVSIRTNVDSLATGINILRPRQNGRHFPDDIFKCIYLNENLWISNIIPTFGIRARAALSCVRDKNAGSYGCYWGVQCRQAPYPEWHVYWFLLISARDIKLCNNLYLSFYRRR